MSNFPYPSVFRQNYAPTQGFAVWYIDPDGKWQYRIYSEPVFLEQEEEQVIVRSVSGDSLDIIETPKAVSKGGGGGGGSPPSTTVWVKGDLDWQGIISFFPPIDYEIFCTQQSIVGGQGVGIPYYLKVRGAVDFLNSQRKKVRTLYFCTVFEVTGPIRGLGTYVEDNQVLLFVKYGNFENLVLLSEVTKTITNPFYATLPLLDDSLVIDTPPLILRGDYHLEKAELLGSKIWRKDRQSETLIEVLSPPICTLIVRDRVGVIATKQFLGRPQLVTNADENPPD